MANSTRPECSYSLGELNRSVERATESLRADLAAANREISALQISLELANRRVSDYERIFSVDTAYLNQA